MYDYIFDKRKVKRLVLKYLVVFILGLIPVILFNIYVGPKINNYALVVFIDFVILLTIVLIGKLIFERFYEKQDEKLELKQKERKKLQERKKQILADSYKKKRKQKKENKLSSESTKDKENSNGKK